MLAVACTDRKIRLISAFSGKTVHQLETLPQAFNAEVSCLAWTANFTDVATTQRQLDEAGEHVVLDDLFSLNADIPTLLKAKANLPRELMSIDVESSLPKLSTLPATGGE